MTYKNFADAVRQAGKVSYSTALRRYKKGMSTEQAVSLPPDNDKSHMIGVRYGRLTIMERDMSRAYSKDIRWTCLCDCGTKIAVYQKNLKDKRTKSCGCLRKEIAASRKGKTRGAI